MMPPWWTTLTEILAMCGMIPTIQIGVTGRLPSIITHSLLYLQRVSKSSSVLLRTSEKRLLK